MLEIEDEDDPHESMMIRPSMSISRRGPQVSTAEIGDGGSR